MRPRSTEQRRQMQQRAFFTRHQEQLRLTQARRNTTGFGLIGGIFLLLIGAVIVLAIGAVVVFSLFLGRFGA